MHSLEHQPLEATRKPAVAARLMGAGIAFTLIGALAVLLPAWATLAGELLVAWILVLWGIAGMWFAWEMRPEREWRYSAGVFGATFALGLAFLLFPGAGIASLTIVLMLVLLLEGIVSILLGLRISGRQPNWGWMLLSGTCSLLIGIAILAGWPETAVLTLGLLLGLNFISTGLSLVMLARAAKRLV